MKGNGMYSKTQQYGWGDIARQMVKMLESRATLKNMGMDSLIDLFYDENPVFYQKYTKEEYDGVIKLVEDGDPVNVTEHARAEARTSMTLKKNFYDRLKTVAILPKEEEHRLENKVANDKMVVDYDKMIRALTVVLQISPRKHFLQNLIALDKYNKLVCNKNHGTAYPIGREQALIFGGEPEGGKSIVCWGIWKAVEKSGVHTKSVSSKILTTDFQNDTLFARSQIHLKDMESIINNGTDSPFIETFCAIVTGDGVTEHRKGVDCDYENIKTDHMFAIGETNDIDALLRLGPKVSQRVSPFYATSTPFEDRVTLGHDVILLQGNTKDDKIDDLLQGYSRVIAYYSQGIAPIAPIALRLIERDKNNDYIPIYNGPQPMGAMGAIPPKTPLSVEMGAMGCFGGRTPTKILPDFRILFAEYLKSLIAAGTPLTADKVQFHKHPCLDWFKSHGMGWQAFQRGWKSAVDHLSHPSVGMFDNVAGVGIFLSVPLKDVQRYVSELGDTTQMDDCMTATEIGELLRDIFPKPLVVQPSPLPTPPSVHTRHTHSGKFCLVRSDDLQDDIVDYTVVTKKLKDARLQFRQDRDGGVLAVYFADTEPPDELDAVRWCQHNACAFVEELAGLPSGFFARETMPGDLPKDTRYRFFTGIAYNTGWFKRYYEDQMSKDATKWRRNK